MTQLRRIHEVLSAAQEAAQLREEQRRAARRAAERSGARGHPDAAGGQAEAAGTGKDAGS